MKTQLHGLFLLWLGAAISIAEIVTGTLMAPLGWQRGLAAILVGHLIGCGLFLLPAAYLSAQQHQSAIGVTQTVFGPWGVRLFSLLNALQLLGWTAVMIVNAQLAMNGISQHLLGFHSAVLMASIVAALIIVWLLLDHDWLFRVNNLVVILLAVGMLVMMGAILATGHVHPSHGAALSFGSAVELNVTMALSWLPLIGDYTRKTTQPWRASLVSVSGYFLGSVAMFAIGLFTVILTGQADFTAVLAQSKIGILALLVIVFSTVTTTFMDAFSAATNLNNLVHRGHVNLWGVGVTVVGLAIALGVSMTFYQNFLYAIGAVFSPLFAILAVSVFGLKQRLAVGWNFAWWLVGVIGYSWLQKLDFFGGTTLLLLLGLSVGVYLTSRVTRRYPLMTKQD
ncbi:putative hydroxymethylpyrimidine transporter CytX [Levilactobacillus namurensis]|uniref:putative hydroxymethylpyrimidine transporter CytX n=1 Tax=Levilactobacillus namurensis TaxID=380393 RepID=UPI0028B2C852|nr:putative hydroxymethylpyrimidine transporter CytX [Levilactobacillus namurensis]MDT7019779.1 putative hydroxymethylpyrimidine transporter CytX [Levilactobacillus namurensis]WNN65634.1 putative hydroxymethylpyrimidine transporter CytX [Levilactobacillus namurensis]